MSVIDDLNKLGTETYGDLQAKGQEQLQKIQHQRYNPLDDLAGGVSEWIDSMQKAGDKVSAAASKVYADDPSMTILDDMALPQLDDSNISLAQEKVAIALQDTIDDARYAATKDPITLVGDVAGAVNPWIPLAVQVPIMIRELQMAQRQKDAPALSDQAQASLLPMLGGAVASSLTHGVGGLLSGVAPKVSKAMTTPFVGSGVAAGTMLAMDDNVLKYAAAHPARFAVSTFTTDVAITAKKLSKMNWDSQTSIKADTDGVSEKSTNKTNAISDTPKVNENSVQGDNSKTKRKRKRKKKKDIWVEDEVTTPTEVTTRKPSNAIEEAFPETMPERDRQQQVLADKLANDVQQARRTPEIMQGAYGEKLVYGTDNIYPKLVSVEQIWQTAKALFPVRPKDNLGSETTLGTFDPRSKMIYMRGFTSWSTLCHEVGHGLSDRLNWGKEAEIQKELYDGAISIWKNNEYGDSKAPANYDIYVEEGRAAFMNEYFINPAQAKKHFPLAYAEFEKKLLSSDRMTEATVSLLGQQVRKWGNSSPMAKAIGSVHWGASVLPIAQRVEQAWEAFKKGVLDELYPLRDTITNHIERFDIKLRNEDNPAVIAQRIKEQLNATIENLMGDSGIETDVIIQAVSDAFGVPLYKVTMRDVLDPIFSLDRSKLSKQMLTNFGVSDGKGWYEVFNIYLAAKHSLDIVKHKGKDYQTFRPIEELQKIVADGDAIPEFAEASQRWNKWNENILRLAVAGQIIKKSDMDNFLKLYPNYVPMQRSFVIEGNHGMTATNGGVSDGKGWYEVFNIYLAAKHSLDIVKHKGKDYQTFRPIEELQKIVADGDAIPEFAEASQRWNKWNENILRLAVAGQIIKKSDMDNFLKLYPNYVPMQRSFVIEGNHGMTATNGGDSTFVNLQNSIHALTENGSTRPIKDPLTQAVLNMQAIINKVERNRVGLALASLAKGENGAYLMSKAESGHVSKNKQIVYVWENGEKVAYECNATGLYEAIAVADKSTQKVMLNIIQLAARHAASVVRYTATNFPTFGIANVIKDSTMALLINPVARKTWIPLVDQLFLLADGWKGMHDKKLLAEYKAQGVQYTSRKTSSSEITWRLKDQIQPKDNILTKILELKYVKMFTEFSDKSEIITRMSLYKRAREKGMSPFDAACLASDGTTNFMRAGTSSKAINRYVPFFNASIQGNSAWITAMRKDPVGFTTAVGIYLVAPSIGLWWLNQDKDWYRDMSLEMKNKNWYFPITDDVIIAIPKPEFLGSMCSLLERVLDATMSGDVGQGAISKTAESAVTSHLIPSHSLSFILPLMEWITNYNFYRGRPIVNQHYANLPDEEQYSLYTTELAKGIGKTFGVSPMKVDNTIYDLTTTMGRTALEVVDIFMKDNQTPNKKWTEYTRFTFTRGTSGTRSADVFYDGITSLTKQAKSAKARKDSKYHNEMVAKLKGMNTAKRNASKITANIKKLEESPLDGATKRKQRDILVEQRNNIYRNANKKYLNYKYIQSPE